jgi:TP901 family phage tail tape measure protein
MARRNSTLGRSVLDLDIDDSAFHSKLSGAARAAAGFTAQSGKDLMKAGKAISGVGDSMTRNITLPIIAAGGAVAHFALDFDTTMRRIVGLAKVPKDAIAGVREEILKMGAETGRAPQELGEAFYFVASAGFKAKDAMEVLRISAKAAAAGMGQTQDIAKTLGGVINAYGHENLSAAHAGDILTAAIQDGAAEASDFAGVIGFVVPVAASLGVSFDQVTAALAAMTQVGISADTAATNLGQVMAALQKPTKEAEEALKGLGLSSAGLRQELREKGLLATLRTLEAAFAGNADASAIVFGNIRALRGVTALLGLDTAQLNGIFADTAGALGNLQQAYDDTEGPQREIDRNMAKLQATAIALGADVLPMLVQILGQVADALGGFAKWWSKLDKGTRETIVHLLAFIAVMGPVLAIVGRVTTGLGGLLRVIGYLAGAKGIKALSTEAGKSTRMLGLWGAAILVVYEALKLGADAFNDWMSVIIRGRKGAKALKDLTDIFADEKFAKLFLKSGHTVADAMELIERAGGDAGYAMEVLEQQGGDLGKALDYLSDHADEAGTALGVRMGRNLKEAQAAAHNAGKAIPEDLAATLVDGEFVVGAAIDDTLSPIDEALQKAVKDTGDRAQEMIDALAGKLADGPNQIKDELDALREALLHPYTDVARRADLETALANKVIAANLKSGDSQTEALAAQQVEDWLAQYELLAPGALASGKLINPALKKGIDANLDALLKWIKDDAGVDITDAFDFADVLESMGLNSLAGYVRGLEMGRLGEFTREMTTLERDAHEKTDIDLQQSGESTMDSYADGLRNKRQAAIDAAAETQRRVAATLAFSARMGGISVINSWVDGMRYQLDAQYRQFVAKVGMYSDILGNSLPVAGPLQHPDRGGKSIIEAWGERGLVPSVLAVLPSLWSAVGEISDVLTAPLPMPEMASIGTPVLPGVGALGPDVMATSTNASSLAGTLVTINGGIHFHDVGNDLSPEAKQRFSEEIIDTVATSLQEQGSRFGSRPRVSIG